MTTVNDMISKMKALNIKDAAFHSVEDTKGAITEIQKEQMFKGFDAKHTHLKEYKRESYAKLKNRMNPLPGFGNPDLKLTGDFYAGFETKVTPEIFSTSSKDWKNDMLIKKYDPFGLDTESKSDYVEKLRPAFVKNVKEKLQI